MRSGVMGLGLLIVGGLLLAAPPVWGEEPEDAPRPPPEWFGAVRFIGYCPSEFDPRPDQRKVPSSKSISEDLKALRPRFDGLVLYASGPPAEKILEVASRLRFKGVVLGVWDVKSEKELGDCVRLAGKFPRLVKAVCLGNEGLTFNRYALDELEGAFRTMRKRLPGVPLSTTEPISEYGNRRLHQLVDLHMPNIHPFFSLGKEADIGKAADWTLERAEALLKTSGKCVLIKECGWPSAGADGCTPERQMQYWRTFLARFAARERPRITWAGFEAFDLAFKAAESGLPFEEHWGFWTTGDRRPKPVVEAFTKLPAGRR